MTGQILLEMNHRPDFTTKERVRATLDWINPNRPTLEQDMEILSGNRLRIWNEPAIQNERFLDAYILSPLHGFDQAKTVSLAYDACIPEDMAMTADGAKLPGLTGMWDGANVGFPLPYAFADVRAPAKWELRLWHGPKTARGYHLGCYAYLVRNPTVAWQRTDGAGFGIPGQLHDVPGIPSWPGKYYGSGNQQQGGWDDVAQKPTGLMTSGWLIPGKVHRIEQIITLNTLADPNFRPQESGQQGLDEALANARTDGILIIKLDGVIVGEWRDVAFRGETQAGFFAVWLNYYQGGTKRFVSARSHFDIGNVEITAEPNQQPQGDSMETVDVSYDPSKVTVNLVTGGNPLQAQLDTANTTIATLTAKINAAKAAAQADNDADKANVAGQGVLDALA